MLIISRNRIHNIITRKFLVYAERQLQRLLMVPLTQRHPIPIVFIIIDAMLNFDVDALVEQSLMLWLVTLINSEKTLQEILQKELYRKE